MAGLVRSDEKKQLEKARKLYDALRENQAKGYALLDELGAVLAGDVSIGDKLKLIEVHFAALWEGRYSGKYLWAYVKDKPQAKRLLASMAVEEIQSRMNAYIRDDDQYLTRARHPFGLFVSQVNRYAGVGQATTQDFDLEAPADCGHTPRCKSDQEHTRRRAEDLRR